jgi:hypothetical protein
MADWPAGGIPRFAMVFGPPRTRRGRIANRIRRLLGRDERDELYTYFGPQDLESDSIKLAFTADGIITLQPDVDRQAINDRLAAIHAGEPAGWHNPMDAVDGGHG